MVPVGSLVRARGPESRRREEVQTTPKLFEKSSRNFINLYVPKINHMYTFAHTYLKSALFLTIQSHQLFSIGSSHSIGVCLFPQYFPIGPAEWLNWQVCSRLVLALKKRHLFLCQESCKGSPQNWSTNSFVSGGFLLKIRLQLLECITIPFLLPKEKWKWFKEMGEILNWMWFFFYSNFKCAQGKLNVAARVPSFHCAAVLNNKNEIYFHNPVVCQSCGWLDHIGGSLVLATLCCGCVLYL